MTDTQPTNRDAIHWTDSSPGALGVSHEIAAHDHVHLRASGECLKRRAGQRCGTGDVPGSAPARVEPEEAGERGDFPCCTTPAPVSGAGLDLDAIEARASAVPSHIRQWHSQANIAKVPNLVNFDDLAETSKASYAILHTNEASPGVLLGVLSAHIAGMDPATTLTLVAEVRRKSQLAADNHLRAESAEAEVVALRAKVAAVEALGSFDAYMAVAPMVQVRVVHERDVRAALATTGEGQ